MLVTRRGLLKSAVVFAVTAAAVELPQYAFAEGETKLKDVMLMLIEGQNAKGGLLSQKLKAVVVVDPASDWPLFAEKARGLISADKCVATFGCWTSVSRKSVLPVFEELNSMLFYPVQYDGEESSKNVFYTGAARRRQHSIL